MAALTVASLATLSPPSAVSWFGLAVLLQVVTQSFVAAANDSAFPVVHLDLFRAVPGAVADGNLTEDNDLADLAGVLKYLHTEILTEHLGDPGRTSRKYGIDSIRRQRLAIRNPDVLLSSTPVPDFGRFVTYDFGEATNKAEWSLFEEFGDFVGIQEGCSEGECDPRYPAYNSYNWFSVGNWCPNLPFTLKGSRSKPNPACLKHNATGDFVLGGLCPGGYDTHNTIPKVEPTGHPGCVYSYGRSSFILLDDLVGITREPCHGQATCKDWKHFRNNCSSHLYRRKFDKTGRLEDVEYCVEYDIHPDCEASCHTPACRALLIKGETIEVGLPFWQGRCFPEDNLRRQEAAAMSFQVAGATTRHQTVDQALLLQHAPCVHVNSSNCRPTFNGSSGPYCSRASAGVCERCFIPRAKSKEEGSSARPVPEPYCPFNILEMVDYRNNSEIPPPMCHSNRPREMCCLYTNSCNGSSNPKHATLDDDGLALVGARQSTDDMAEFLKRAFEREDSTTFSASQVEGLRKAAYYEWSQRPLGRSLAVTMARVRSFLKDPPPELRAVPTTAVVTTTPGTNCFDYGAAFYPLDMEGTELEHVASAWECQRRCMSREGCAHFSYLESLGHCHLQDFLAARLTLNTGYSSGPFSCWEDMNESARKKLSVQEHHTYLPAELSCVKLHAAYAPAMQTSLRPPDLSGLNAREAAIACQRYCAAVDGCVNFTFSRTLQLCTLASEGATRLSIMNSVAGPPSCLEQDEFVMRKFADKHEGPSSHSQTPILSRGWLYGWAGAVVAGVSFLAFQKRFRHRRATGVRDMGRTTSGELKELFRLRQQEFGDVEGHMGAPNDSPRGEEDCLLRQDL